ncbi:hypothetical protein EJB05_44460, partial [Eragrostis curvula]
MHTQVSGIRCYLPTPPHPHLRRCPLWLRAPFKKRAGLSVSGGRAAASSQNPPCSIPYRPREPPQSCPASSPSAPLARTASATAGRRVLTEELYFFLIRASNMQMYVHQLIVLSVHFFYFDSHLASLDIMVKKKSSWNQTVQHDSLTNQSITTRNLQPEDLGAVIFGCTNITFAECHARQLFGLPRAHLSYVQNIKEGLPLFLFNYDDRRLHGIYEAASNGKFCPQSNAWSRNGKTGYPAQVAMRLRLWCFPLAESQFRNAILTNYYQRMPGVPSRMRHCFQFELDHAQTHALMNMFTPLPSPYNFWTDPVAEPVHDHVRTSTLSPLCAPECEDKSDVKSEKFVKPCADMANTGKFKDLGYVGANKDCKVQQQQSQHDKKLNLELERPKELPPQQHSSEFCGKATATADINDTVADINDTYSCKDSQEMKRSVNLPENLDAKVDQLPLRYPTVPVQLLDFKSCTEAKMMKTGCTSVKELSTSQPAITQQFQETEAQLTQPVYETPNNNNDNGVPEATVPSAHPRSHYAEITSIQPLTLSSSQEPMRDDNSVQKGRKRKAVALRKQKAKTLAIQRRLSGHHKIQSIHPTEQPSPDNISWHDKDRLLGKITCMVCGEEGHYTCHCPMKDRDNKVICTLCNKVGHCYLWCCRQHVSENRACRRCGEKGHYTNKDLSHTDEKYATMYVRCSSCDESHSLGRCPKGKVTCFLCEGKDHVPAQCRLSPILTVTQHYRESFRAILKQALAETSRRAVTPVKICGETELHDSHECQFKRNGEGEMALKVSSFSHSGQGHCERKSAIRSVPDTDKINHEALMDKTLTLESSSACFKCHEEGHYAKRCPKKMAGASELHDVTCFKFKRQKKKKRPAELELCDVICFYCHNKGHYSYNCPTNKPPGGLELHDVTCINFDANTCDKTKPPEDLLCHVICFKCHDKGHYAYSCPSNKPQKRGPKNKRKMINTFELLQTRFQGARLRLLRYIAGADMRNLTMWQKILSVYNSEYIFSHRFEISRKALTTPTVQVEELFQLDEVKLQPCNVFSYPFFREIASNGLSWSL